MRLSILTIATTFTLSLVAHAEQISNFETKTEPVSETPSQRTCRIVFPGRPNDAPKHAYLFDGKECHRINLPSMNFSKVLELPSGELTLSLTSDQLTKPENLPLAAPKLTIAAGVSDFYILLSADPTNVALPAQMRLIDTSDGKLKPGQTLWTNLTDHRIVATFGEKDLKVEPMDEAVSSDPTANSGYYRAEFSYQAHAKGNIREVTKQQWWHDAKSRHLGFIVDSKGRLPKIYFYRDFRQ